jgi:predicted sulfurtransferase
MIVNIAGYKFIDINNAEEMKEIFLNKCLDLRLKGTIYFSENGVNFFIAGTQEMIDKYVNFMHLDKRLTGISLKKSYTEYQPFRRMIVKKKNEIISLGLDEVRPVEYTSPSIKPKQLKKWLDEERDILLLDTRNDYELRIGTFENAVDLDIKTFREFPTALKELNTDKNKTVVMFCTGGIRCEKASIVMENQGWNNVFQLEGGVLNYFEEVGGEHWNGDCFVFDQRVALNSELEETEIEMCFICREPLSKEEQESEEYKILEYCPYCVNKNNK